MQRPTNKTHLGLALSAMLLASTLHAEVLTRQAAHQALGRADVSQRLGRLRTLAAKGDVEALLREVQSLTGRIQEQSLAHDAVLDAALQELSRLQPTDAAYMWVESISQRAPRFFVRIDPNHSDATAPLFDPGATARYVLHTWRRAAARDALLAELATAPAPSLERFATAGPAERAGMLDALRSAPPAQLASQRTWMLGQAAGTGNVAEAALVVAQRLDDRELLEQALMTSPPLAALRVLPMLRDQFGADAARQSLIALSARPEIASAALLELGVLAREDSAARVHLFSRIGDPVHGDSAAAALASTHEPAVIEEMGRRLLTAKHDAARRQLALALKLEGSSASKAHLERFLKNGGGSSKLRKEVRSWVAQ